jgi:hypothetical protein
MRWRSMDNITKKMNLRIFKLSFISISVVALLFSMCWQLFAPSETLARVQIWEYVSPNNLDGDFRYTKRQENLFREAALRFWISRSGNPLHDSPEYVQFCHPKDVKIIYIKDDPAVLARVKEIDYADNMYLHNTGFCTIYINGRFSMDGRAACVMFIHEYGHLLGREHTNDVGSPMFTQFESQNINDTQKHKRWARNQLNRIKKSICSAFELN